MTAAIPKPAAMTPAAANRRVTCGLARLAASKAPATVPTAMIDESNPYWPAPVWKTVTDIVEMKIGKFSPNVPYKNNMSSTAFRSGRFAT